MIEIVITLGIVLLAIYFLVKRFKKKNNNGCNCVNCSSKCPIYDKNKM